MTPSKKQSHEPKPAAQPQSTPAVQQPAAAPVAAETPKPQAAAPAPSKQMQTVDTLVQGWKAKGVDLSKLTQVQDGKFINLVVAEGWPVVAVGPTGGINLPAIRSYNKPYDAALEGKALLEKQTARDAKKAAPAPAKAQAAQTEQPKPETTTQRKAKASDQIEKQLATA
jgi:hypothetical protein